MAERQTADPREPSVQSLRTCPDCGGILEPSQPKWTTMVDLFAGTPQRPSAQPQWRCLICGYRA